MCFLYIYFCKTGVNLVFTCFHFAMYVLKILSLATKGPLEIMFELLHLNVLVFLSLFSRRLFYINAKVAE